MEEKLTVVSKTTFRSPERRVNQDDDMVRIVIDAPILSHRRILDLLAQAQQPVAPIGVDLSGVKRYRPIFDGVDMAESRDGSWVRFSDLEKLLALPQTDKGEGWISVKDRLPEQNESVLVWDTARKRRLVCQYLGVNFWFADPERMERRSYSIGTTHWQPLPSPPQDAGKVKPT